MEFKKGKTIYHKPTGALVKVVDPEPDRIGHIIVATFEEPYRHWHMLADDFAEVPAEASTS